MYVCVYARMRLHICMRWGEEIISTQFKLPIQARLRFRCRTHRGISIIQTWPTKSNYTSFSPINSPLGVLTLSRDTLPVRVIATLKHRAWCVCTFNRDCANDRFTRSRWRSWLARKCRNRFRLRLGLCAAVYDLCDVTWLSHLRRYPTRKIILHKNKIVEKCYSKICFSFFHIFKVKVCLLLFFSLS